MAAAVGSDPVKGRRLPFCGSRRVFSRGALWLVTQGSLVLTEDRLHELNTTSNLFFMTTRETKHKPWTNVVFA
jgi:hypothetical protein